MTSSGERVNDDEAEECEGGEYEEEESNDEDASSYSSLPYFYAVPLWRVALFGLLGSNAYVLYWSYRCWLEYRQAWGYSREPFWRKVHGRTGYRISPFWRAALASLYAFALFPAVDRECRKQGVQGLGAPIVLALLLGMLTLFAGKWLIGPVWVLLPVQTAINRLNRDSRPPPITAGEILSVCLGLLLQLLQTLRVR